MLIYTYLNMGFLLYTGISLILVGILWRLYLNAQKRKKREILRDLYASQNSSKPPFNNDARTYSKAGVYRKETISSLDSSFNDPSSTVKSSGFMNDSIFEPGLPIHYDNNHATDFSSWDFGGGSGGGGGASGSYDSDSSSLDFSSSDD